jgi:hypothetical protein
MTYALAWPLQKAVHATLAADPAVAALVAGRIWDAPPPLAGEAAPEGLYLTLGDESAEDWSTQTDRGAAHEIRIAVNAPREGFAEAKQAAAAVCDALLGAELAPERGHVVCLGFVSAETRREQDGRMRRILLRFRALVEDTP